MPQDDYQYREQPLPNKRTPNPESMLGTVIGANNGNSPDGFGVGGGGGQIPSNSGSGSDPSGMISGLNPGQGGGGGGGGTTCASTSDIGTLNVGTINFPCSGSPVSSINEFLIHLEDVSNSTFEVNVSTLDGLMTLDSDYGLVSIDLAPIFDAFPGGDGVVELREFDVCVSGVAMKRLILASQPYTP